MFNAIVKGNARNAAKNPIFHITIETHKIRLFHNFESAQIRASSTSLGQLFPGRKLSHADSTSIKPEMANTHVLC